MAPLIVEPWPCRHSSLCLTEWQRALAGAADKLGRGSLAWGAEQGTGRAAARHRGQPGLQWVERDRIRIFKGLVEETRPLLELELENGLSWGPSVCEGTPGTLPAREVVTRPACQDAGICAEANVTSVASSRVLQLNDRTSPLGNSYVRHPCSEQPNAFVTARTLGLKQKET